MITISKLTKSFGARDLFRDADLSVGARDRLALVGPNGTGKTTLFEMIAGRQGYDSGTIDILTGAVVGYLEQETDALRGKSVIDEVVTAGGGATQIGHRIEVLQHEIAETEPGDERDALVAEYGRLQHRFETLGGYSLEADAKRILGGLGFSEDDMERPTDRLSGGWLMRVALAKLLLAGPDILMLDEPTNHLDVASVEWLERFLGAYEGCVLMISHDRDLIDGFASRVVEIDEAKLVSYTGGYSSFVEQRTLRAEQAAAEARNRSKKVAETQAFIDRFRYKATKAKQVQSRIKMLEKMDDISGPSRQRKAMGLRFPQPPRSGRDVLILDDVHFSYGDVKVYEGLDAVIERGQKVALVGPNGAGKSTFLKLAAGVLEPSAGERRLGHNVSLAYFAQHQIDALKDDNRVLEELASAIPPTVDARPRDLLGRFLFSGDAVDKKVGVLSGGERTRLALAKLLVTPANMLCLDEPTNHLDIQSRDVLEDALIEYEGSMLLITHDRHLIRSVADRIIEVIDGRVTVFDGGYDYYLERREPPVDETSGPESAEKRAIPAKERRRLAAEHRSRTKEIRDEIADLEKKIESLSATQKETEAVLGDPDSYTKGEDIAGLSREYERRKQRLTDLESRWTAAAALLEELDREAPG